jgi:ArsR family transcriptional regulator
LLKIASKLVFSTKTIVYLRYKIKAMALDKKNAFPELEVEIAEVARILSHPARIAILQTLAEKQSCICGEIVEVLPLSQSTVSQHLKELKEAGFIDGKIDGVKSCYCINWVNLQQAIAQLTQRLQQIEALAPTSGCC